MQERRQLPRWHIGKEVKVRIGEANHFNGCTVEDMNLKGMCVMLSYPLPQDRPIRLAVFFMDNLDFEVEVHVPWVKEKSGGYIHGLSFRIIMDEEKDKIYQYISHHCSQQIKKKWWGR